MISVESKKVESRRSNEPMRCAVWDALHPRARSVRQTIGVVQTPLGPADNTVPARYAGKVGLSCVVAPIVSIVMLEFLNMSEPLKPLSSSEPAEHEPGKVSRRSFLSKIGAAGVVVSAAPVIAAAQGVIAPQADAYAQAEKIEGAIPLSLRVNGKTYALNLDPRTTLLDALRETISLTGTKKGCDHGQCGACTVHIDGRRVNSCLTLAVMHDGQEITTIEGLGQPGSLHPMQSSFVEHDGYQCGYCTSGQIMSAVALLKEPCGSADGDVKEAMAGNICRCGAYPNIVAAIQHVRQRA